MVGNVYTVTKPIQETIMNRFATLLAALPLAGCLSIADAGALVDVSVVDRQTGERLEVHRHQGRFYVAGTPGSGYVVRLHNRTAGRLLTVLSVDGINAISGETAATSQSGYVLPAGQSAEVAGWRKSMDEVAAFYFTSLADSYAARTDRPRNVGVIAVAVFRESVAPAPAVARSSRDSEADAAGASPSAAAAAKAAPAAEASANEAARARQQAASRLGTGHGERLSAPTQYTDFRRASDHPVEIVSIHYDSRARLLAQGVIPRPRQSPQPNPFPGGFAPDPRS
ncbi:MAG: hypothetical protein AW08_03576 [Candidatus Accumulibacter adjunctus]|uniref:Uncharacterized protein n=1 Tax=Candidatus Accumulibacter adjunctus TaxID=1454001 RepID=A0A011M5T9_9PROT|nr:MAG: hypothetical protein AW08_03576 [Candidatus Accumulibacter adjunctus]